MIEEKHAGNFDYFYLPMDLKTLYNRGYAYINFIHPIFILDFYLEFQNLRWSERFTSCNSAKTCALFYANVQGKQNNIMSLQNKNIMKKMEDSVKPVSYATQQPNQFQLLKIKQHYSDQLNSQPMLSFYIFSLSQNTEFDMQKQG